jgi:hypothetical protein
MRYGNPVLVPGFDPGTYAAGLQATLHPEVRPLRRTIATGY